MRLFILFPLYFIVVVLMVACSYDAAEYIELPAVEIVDQNNYIEINPINSNPQTCFLFYPGALVQPEAYQNSLQLISEMGYKVIIIKATADLAILNIKRAEKIIRDFPEIENWIIGGHSLGGVVAIKAVLNNEDQFDGLVLFAAYPDKNDDLSNWNGAVLSISAENDSLTTAEKIENVKSLLPTPIVVTNLSEFPSVSTLKETIYFEIAGGNHAQFGDYGVQKDDGIATISTDEQHQQISQAMLLFFSRNNW